MTPSSKDRPLFALASFVLFAVLFLFLSVAAILSFSSSVPPSELPNPHERPPLYVEPDVVDFQEVEEGVHEKTVDLVNSSDQKIVLLFARNSCSCGVARIPADSISPQERLPLLCTLTTTGREGIVGGSVMIAYRFESDPEEAPARMTSFHLRGRVSSSRSEEEKRTN